MAVCGCGEAGHISSLFDECGMICIGQHWIQQRFLSFMLLTPHEAQLCSLFIPACER
jgi:hypothetical protein